MASLAYDLAFLKTGTPELKDYLLSREIYWPIGGRSPKGEPRFPRLTLGWVLLSLHRASARVQLAGERRALAEYRDAIEGERSKWRAAWETKAALEFDSRLKLWGQYLNDVRRAPKESVGRYAYEVNRRVLLQILLGETGKIGAESLKLLSVHDKFLRGKFGSGSFLWEPEIASAFPQGDYWFLYGSLTP